MIIKLILDWLRKWALVPALGLALLCLLGLFVQSTSLKKASQSLAEAQTELALYEGSLKAEKRRSEALLASAQRAQDALESRAKEAEAQAQRIKAQQKALSKALKENEEWANERIPTEVLEAIS